jgi:hypothetical protein
MPGLLRRTVDVCELHDRWTRNARRIAGAAGCLSVSRSLLYRIYPNDKPNCEGLKRVESWSYGLSDYVGRNGPYRGYMVTTLENGDKTFSEFSGTS